jgi:hypothetical protein
VSLSRSFGGHQNRFIRETQFISRMKAVRTARSKFPAYAPSFATHTGHNINTGPNLSTASVNTSIVIIKISLLTFSQLSLREKYQEYNTNTIQIHFVQIH